LLLRLWEKYGCAAIFRCWHFSLASLVLTRRDAGGPVRSNAHHHRRLNVITGPDPAIHRRVPGMALILEVQVLYGPASRNR
jgi:hypothetical protein